MKVLVRNQSNNPLPEYKTSGAAALDIALSEDVVIEANKVTLAHTGLYLEIPKGCCVYLMARSSLHKHGLLLANSVGLIDSDYRGELMVPLLNYTDSTVSLSAGERVAQIMLHQVCPIEWQVVSALSETQRGSGGFGSTNTH